MKNRTTGYPKIFILLILLILPLINLTNATTIIGDGQINDTLVTSIGLNLSINFTSSLWGAFQIDTNSIYVENLRSSDAALCTVSFNLTEVNRSYYGIELPLFSSCGSNPTTITSNLTNNPSNTEITIPSTANTVIYTNSSGSSVNFTDGNAGWFYSGNIFDSNNGLITFGNISLGRGNNLINTLNNGSELTACNTSLNAFIGYIALLGLLGTIIFFGWLFAYLFGMVDKQTFKNVNIVGSITILILLGVLLIITIVIFSTLCSVF